jgi:tagatose-1,6-bisphosphate aldolase non-catalytic subunit AgaZ/GatZ
MEVTRVSIGKKRLVYVIVTKKPLKYKWGRSRIAYIGTTQKGLSRIAQSVAARAQEVLDLYGVREFWVRVVTCSPKPGVKTWVKLERAMILSFREKYGEVPKCNKQGKKIREKDEFKYFTRSRIKTILSRLK